MFTKLLNVTARIGRLIAMTMWTIVRELAILPFRYFTFTALVVGVCLYSYLHETDVQTASLFFLFALLMLNYLEQVDLRRELKKLAKRPQFAVNQTYSVSADLFKGLMETTLQEHDERKRARLEDAIKNSLRGIVSVNAEAQVPRHAEAKGVKE